MGRYVDKEILEVSCSIYETGAYVFLIDGNLAHDMVVVPEEERIPCSYGFDVDNTFQDWYGQISDDEKLFYTKVPLIGIDITNVSQVDDIYRYDYPLSMASEMTHEMGKAHTYGGIVKHILEELNRIIDKSIDKLPHKKHERDVHFCRFLVMVDVILDYDEYECDSEIKWRGVIDINEIKVG